jgi:hypothetical protein
MLLGVKGGHSVGLTTSTPPVNSISFRKCGSVDVSQTCTSPWSITGIIIIIIVIKVRMTMLVWKIPYKINEKCEKKM